MKWEDLDLPSHLKQLPGQARELKIYYQRKIEMLFKFQDFGFIRLIDYLRTFVYIQGDDLSSSVFKVKMSF